MNKHGSLSINSENIFPIIKKWEAQKGFCALEGPQGPALYHLPVP